MGQRRLTEYTDLRGDLWDLSTLDAEERRLFNRLCAYARRHTYEECWNLAFRQIAALYDRRGKSRSAARRTLLFRVVQDLVSRKLVEQGEARPPDYRDDLEELIRTHFATRRAFCKVTGISEAMLSHVLAKRKHLAIDTFAEALSRAGFRLRISPLRSDKA
jgi:hypothetical protein